MVTRIPPPQTAHGFARMASEFAETYDLAGVKGLWVRPHGSGFEVACLVAEGAGEHIMEEVETLATEMAAQLEFGTPVNVVFVSVVPRRSEFAPIVIRT